MIHYLYKTVRVTDGRYYIGIHSTENFNDGYLGSGKILVASIKKHGQDVHRREVLQTVGSREELRALEREVVNEALLKDEACMNLVRGGDGGFEPGGEIATIVSIKAKERWSRDKDSLKASMKQAWSSPTLRTKKSEATNRQWQSEVFRASVTEAAKNRTGEKNNQYGSCWVNKNGKNKKIKGIDLEVFINIGYKKGRIMTTGLMNKGSTWMNNGQIEATVREDQINSYIQKGYVMGRLQTKILTTEATPQVGPGKTLLQEA